MEKSNTGLGVSQENRLKQMGATVEKLNAMGKMSVDQLSDLVSFYHTMAQISSQLLQIKLHASSQSL